MTTSQGVGFALAFDHAKQLAEMCVSKVYIWQMEPDRYLTTVTLREWVPFAVVIPPRKVTRQ